MIRLIKSTVHVCLAAAGLLLSAPACGTEDGIPHESAIARAEAGWQRLLLNPMEDAESVTAGGWKMSGTYSTPASELTPKLGRAALTLGAAHAELAGSKGDFRIGHETPGQVQTVGLWVHLTSEANVARVGVQVYDAQGEALMILVPADWSGWKWIELDLAATEQSYPQADKNGTADFPLKSIHAVWFTAAPGPTSLTVDGVVALTRLPESADKGPSVDVSLPEMVQAGVQLPASVAATNFSSAPVRMTIRFSLQKDPALYSQPLPDPVFGSDHAAGTHSWLVVDGEVIENTSLTDGKPWTAATTPWQQGHFEEAFQFVDLGQVREIRKMTWLSGDANHSWFVDVFASDRRRDVCRRARPERRRPLQEVGLVRVSRQDAVPGARAEVPLPHGRRSRELDRLSVRAACVRRRR